MTDSAKRLRAWADPVEQGYEVPAAGQAMRDAADEIERLRKENERLLASSAANVEVEYISGLAPVQAEGEIYGKPYYFRARGERWSIDVGINPSGEPDWRFEHDWPGGEFSAGAMTDEEALACINYAASRYNAWRTR